MVTINNPVIPGDAYLQQWLQDEAIVFGCGQLEKGAKGTKHLQLYVVTVPNKNNKNGQSQTWVKTHIHSTAHLDKRRGTHAEAVRYCTKSDTRVAGVLYDFSCLGLSVSAGPWTVGARRS